MVKSASAFEKLFEDQSQMNVSGMHQVLCNMVEVIIFQMQTQ